MPDLYNLFSEPNNPIYFQFPFLMLFKFIYHTIFYYGITSKDIVKPEFNYVLLFIIFHMIQVYGIKYFHANKKFYIAWSIMLVPSLIYLGYTKYQEKQNQNDQLAYWKYLATVQQQQSGPPPPPDGQFPNYSLQKGPSDVAQPQMQSMGPSPIQQPQQPSYTQQNPQNPQLQQYGYSQDLNAQMNNSNSFAQFNTENYDPFSSPYTSL